MESVTLNHHIAWCFALGCRRIAIIFEGEGPVCGREGVGGSQTHGANAVMVVGDRYSSHVSPKGKRGAKISFTFPTRPWRAPRTRHVPRQKIKGQDPQGSMSSIGTFRDPGFVSGRSRLTPEPRNRTAAAAGQMVGDSMRGPAGTAWRGRHGWQPRSSVRHWCNPIPPVFTAHSCSGNLWARVSCDPVGRGGHPSPPRRRQWSPPADRRNQPRDLVNGGATAMTPWVDPP